MNILCRIGLHKWDFNEAGAITAYKISKSIDPNMELIPQKICKKCGKRKDVDISKKASDLTKSDKSYLEEEKSYDRHKD